MPSRRRWLACRAEAAGIDWRGCSPPTGPSRHFLRSEAERRLKRLCEAHALPQPQFNVHVAGYEVDVYWPEARFALEVDGAATHHTRHAFHADRRRDRALAAEGIQVVRVTWPDLNGGLMEQVEAILRRR